MTKILIAEDDQLSQIVLGEFLNSYGTVDVVADGQAAIDLFSEKLESPDRFDLICLDIMMPKVDGQGVLREIRAIEEQKGLTGSDATKIIMTTALSDPKNLMQAMVQGQCNGYLTKPIDHDELKDLLDELGFSAE